MRQHDATSIRRGHSSLGLPRGSGVGDQAASRASAHRGNGERRDERQTQPATMGVGASTGGDRASDLRVPLDQQSGGQRKKPREHHLTTKCAALQHSAGARMLCASAVHCVKAAS